MCIVYIKEAHKFSCAIMLNGILFHEPTKNRKAKGIFNSHSKISVYSSIRQFYKSTIL